MKTRRSCRFIIAAGFAIATLWTSPGTAQVRMVTPVSPIVTPVGPIVTPPPAPTFYVRSYLGKCLDYGPSQTSGTQVFLSACNNSTEQQVQVEEVDARHNVILHAGNKVLGYRPPAPVATLGGGGSGTFSPVYALELQNPAGTGSGSGSKVLAPSAFGGISSANQTFALDGDSIILAADHSLVVQVQNARGANGSPLIVANRHVADAEFWDFNQINGADIDPTKGFVRVGYPGDNLSAYDRFLSLLAPVYGDFCQNASSACKPSPAAVGTVIKIHPDADINLDGLSTLQIPAGVTIRGNRRGILYGPLVHMDHATPQKVMLGVAGDDVRITGLRLRGTSRSTDTNQPDSRAILTASTFVRVIVDHNDISDWTDGGVEVKGNDDLPPQMVCGPAEAGDPLNRPYDALVARNFIHHNEMQNFGYGVEANFGGYPLVEGNTFSLNRHAIAAGYGTAKSGYHAWFNLVLEDGPEQTKYGIPYHTQDFDMHGTGDNGFGGVGGDYVQLVQNTFLGTNRPNYEIRGIPCNASDFVSNVSLESADDAVSVKLTDGIGAVAVPPGTQFVNYGPNRFSSSNPVYHLGVGDFDGDGVQDLFLATGAAWYYAPHGAAEWRFLNAKIETVDGFLFGDFDGDGRTDVVGMNGNRLMVSWGGVSDWEYLNTVNAAITDLAAGKFAGHAAGDRRDDIFWADGQQWYVSAGGSGPFQAVNTSSFRVKNLRFGDFDGGGTTDVLGVVAGRWMVSYSATSAWAALPKSLTNSLDGVVVADFDGDGRADIATSSEVISATGALTGNAISWKWQFSSAGATDWTYRFPQSGGLWNVPIAGAAAIGNFDGNPGADVLTWGDNEHFYYVPGGSLQGPAAWPMYSRQDMR